ncbi:GNAT family N-acetyltransferase [Alkalicella caledoniensis]|uniref:GNAT family N-acetyltransferase n=1 Tax=Alkalicella caledoniensis TaxID=2731377 RepID=A0A7G9W9E8_ALKCA|nr:GNAT family N-acetyltransferase [Alkalicella caledoniensis]QNO15310.1 GNAT family N-acetyltransferase [Alkalicella caledoniensis]
MTIKFRNYVQKERFGSDYHKVIEFLKRINQEEVVRPNFQWSRWAWFISRPLDNEEQKNLIGLWEDEGKIVALATFELFFGNVYVIVDKGYNFLLQEIISYSIDNLSNDGELKIIINDNDKEFQSMAAKNGFRPTEKKQCVAKLEITDNLDYNLPEGFTVTSMADNWDFHQYNSVMWKGFGSKGEPDQSPEMIDWRKTMLSSPHLTPEITIAVVAPNGNYASHCGLWYHPEEGYANVEPVATDPDYRKMGLAKAAIYESVLRAAKLGAKEAYVVSSQQFYYNIGFRPHCTETWWELV